MPASEPVGPAEAGAGARPAFTVIVPTHHRPQLLAEALASVAAQSFTAFECLVVDDGSATAAAVMPADPRFRLIDREEAGGPSAARNEGLRQARGRAVAFLDDDDLWTPERLAIAARTLARADVAVCGSRWMDEPGTVVLRPLDGDVRDEILDVFTPNVGATAVARDKVPTFDEAYLGGQDIEWWLRLAATATVATDPALGLISRRQAGPRTLNGTEARIAGSQRLFEDHAGYFASHPRARGFREYRIGLMHAEQGRVAEARRWLVRSLRSSPRLRTVRSLLGTLRPRASR
jgi:glycosyltransferase involved in cell wall biosynthesis